MARTPEQEMQDSKDFEAAYAEQDPEKTPPEEDDGFGLDPQAVTLEDDGIPNSPEEAIEAEPVQEAAPEMPAEPVQPPGLSKEEQRLKSWEGRLRARDAMGKSVESESAEPASEENGETAAQEASEPSMSADEAMEKLNSDFGPEFTAMINALIDAKVSQSTKGTNDTVQEIIADIVNSKSRAHFEAIADAHPDFVDVEKSQEFRSFVLGMPEPQKTEAIRVIKTGSAKEINALLSAFKSSANPAAVNANVDAAEGVRSSGMRLPVQPPGNNDYEAAWKEFD